MFDPQWFAKTIVETRYVQEQVAILHDQYARFDQVWEGLTWLLARKAHELGRPFRGYRVYKHSGITRGNQSPALTLLFEVRDCEVEIISIQVSDPECNFEELDF
ncbi:hypothetical protein [Pantanalinema sp. GBBB05]|uniref:hypothetical protein n=1 Tax=Pantanalinema sp. GBBB05 TaxID=2604139 RepID=UPI001DFF02BC|nr:hypothetical protein [Pantanalinema sp. GBBB05]